jgi:hypothetical protein
MTLSLRPDLRGCRYKLQLALSDYRSDTGCIEMSMESEGPSVAERRRRTRFPQTSKKPRIAPGLVAILMLCVRATLAPPIA